MARRKSCASRASIDPTYELRIQAALEGLRDGVYQTISEAAKAQKVALPTLSDRARGVHISRCQAHAHRQLLTNEQEDALVAWCTHSALPLSPSTLKGREPSGLSGKTLPPNLSYVTLP
ncbi:hypothetical protein A0H81_03982 [Grifola frondosa]|uniref:HTH psq-type domain-containing protein n=1 Tax=Grifola frondosa TaxID=5627 RepID=A0A1C7MIZ7_GRIFR|nr:hypothetical protein A0H81_03982 [Grifola frondosa]